MLTTRLWMGSVLIALVVGMLIFDGASNLFAFQFAFQFVVAIAACRELVALLGPQRAPIVPLCYLAVVVLTAFNWAFRGVKHYRPLLDIGSDLDPNPRFWVYMAFLAAFVQLAIFLWEMATFREANGCFERMARTWMVVGYLGLLPCFFAQVRWLTPGDDAKSATALALAIFVPKGCDIGAYFTGRLLGRHPMAPILSPKKTWEGGIGGLALAVAICIGIDRFSSSPPLRSDWLLEAGFGLTVGVAGTLGDLAESLIKRDCQQKDASQVVPGFGGVLDVVDAVIFSAPVSYLWFVAVRA